jgi:hypothetical protein
MALRMTCARWQELEGEQILALRTELRSNRLSGSGTNKTVWRRSATPYNIRRSNAYVQTCNRYSHSACCVWRWTAAYTMELTNISHGSSLCMTEYLISARAVIILWTKFAVVPAEIVFDAIEAELERRGVEP